MATQIQDEDDAITGINVTPLVDITLVLLIIFMVTATYIVKQTIEVELPRAAHGGETVNKTFALSEQRRLEFRTEFFNLTNHFNPDPGTVDRNIRSKTFGAVGGGVQGVTTRVIQLGAKLLF